MKPNRSKGESPIHRTVAEKIQFESVGQSIQIEFTEQQLSAHAGTATFRSFLHQSPQKRIPTASLRLRLVF